MIRGGQTAGIAGTVLVHGAAVAFVIVAAHPPRPGPPVYAVELVAAPAPVTATNAPVATAPAPTPSPEPAVAKTPPKPTARPAVKTPSPPKPEPLPAKTPPPRTSPPVPGAQTSRTTRNAAVAPAPGETPSNGTDAVSVKTPGLSFAYPDYLRNIVSEIYRRWERPRGGTLRAEVFFLILRDGSVRDIRFLTPSGDFTFDLQAQGAIEAAANAHAFGPLPDGYPQDVLPVSFFFEPGGAR